MDADFPARPLAMRHALMCVSFVALLSSFSLPARAQPVVITALTADVSFPVQEGTAVRWTATATGGGAPLEYQFLLYSFATSWRIVQGWGTANTFDWTPNTSGAYTFMVQVRSSWGNYPEASFTSGEVLVLGPRPVLASISSTPAFPINVGQSVTFAATAIGGTPPLQYKFWMNGDAWTLLRDYAPDNTVAWTPTVPRTYQLQVWVRSADSTAAYDDFRPSGLLPVSDGPLTVTEVDFSPTGGIRPRTRMTFMARSTGGVPPVAYRFWLYNSCTASWGMLKDYGGSIENQATWTAGSPCVYWVQVWARGAGGQVPYEGYESWRNSPAFVVSDTNLQVTSVSVSPPTVPAGVPVRVSVSTTGGLGPLLYMFWVYDADARVWTLARGYDVLDFIDWVPPAAGHYWIQVWVKNAGSIAPYDAWRNSSVLLVSP